MQPEVILILETNGKNLQTSDATAKRFKQAQHDFIQRTHHDPAVRAIAKDTGIDVCDGSHSNGLQDTVWSTAVQFRQEVQERYSKKHIPVYYKRTQEKTHQLQ